MLAGADGAVELRAFAAPRGGDLWDEIRPQIAAEYAQRGGTATEREGRYGTELHCQLTVRTDDGKTATQPSRVVGINGAALDAARHPAGPRGHRARRRRRRGTTRSPRPSYAGAPMAMPVGRRRCPLTLPPRDQLAPPGVASPMGEKTRLRRTISRWANSTDQDERDLRRTHAEDGCEHDRRRARPRAGHGCAARCAP